MRVLLVVACFLIAAALAQDYGSAPTTSTLANNTQVTAGQLGITSFLTAEDRRFAVALNWARQNPAQFKSLMQGESYIMPEPFLRPSEPANALHYDVKLAAAAHFHVLEEIQMSPADSIYYNEIEHCPNPSKWPGDQDCAPPNPFPEDDGTVKVECFRREGCYNPSEDYYERMHEFGVDVAPYPKATRAGGEFIAAGVSYDGDEAKQLHAVMSLVCDSTDVLKWPKNCTSDDFGSFSTTKGIMFGYSLKLTVQGTGFNYNGNSKQHNYFDTYFASGASFVTTSNPIASAAYMKVDNDTAAYFVMNYREPGRDTAAPRQVGVLYSVDGGETQEISLGHDANAALIYTASSTLHSQCGTADTIEYAFWAVDSKGDTYRYPETGFNLDVCAGYGAGDSDLVTDTSAGVEDGAVSFRGSADFVPPKTANPDLVPSIDFGAASTSLPALALIVAAIFAVLSLL